jgi:hypothetical protein
MTRAGREPAEDLKRRFVTVCQEVGLTVVSANMHLINEAQYRVVLVQASVPDWPHESATLSIMANIPVTGEWPEFVDIRCSGGDDDPLRMNCPWMRDRDKVPIEQLIDQLRETLEEREQVIAAAKLGVPGPYRFERSVWERFDLLGGLA